MVNGIDVSDWQGAVNWGSVRASGYSFAYAKASEGLGTTSTFAANRDGARAAGLLFGAYHFLDWNADPREQAEHFLKVYEPQRGDLPCAVDCEAIPSNVDPSELIAAWLNVVERALFDRRAVIYANQSDAAGFGGDGSFSGHDLWIAAPGEAHAPSVHGFPQIRLWQHSFAGHVNGIDGDVDLDVFLGDLAVLRAYRL